MIKFIKANRFLLSCLTIIFLSSFVASLVQSSFTKVEIGLNELKTDDGQSLIYDLYKPKIAKKDNKVPFVIDVPCFQR